MARKNTIPIRSDVRFAKEIKDMQLKRIKNGRDPALKPVKSARLTLAITRHPLFNKIKFAIVNTDLV